jgi:GGDEF domain-containing protein
MSSSLSAPYRLITDASSGKIIEHHCTASIGVVIFGKESVDGNDLLKWADSAMHESKESG